LIVGITTYQKERRYDNLPGHSELYLVIPVREWDDVQAGMKYK
jgi:hypothetical protein